MEQRSDLAGMLDALSGNGIPATPTIPDDHTTAAATAASTPYSRKCAYRRTTAYWSPSNHARSMSRLFAKPFAREQESDEQLEADRQ